MIEGGFPASDHSLCATQQTAMEDVRLEMKQGSDEMSEERYVIGNPGADDVNYNKINGSDTVHTKDGSTKLQFTTSDVDDGVVLPMHLAFANLTVKVGEKYLLNNVSGEVLPGEILAIMGPSGAGKTTLLSLLAGRKTTTGGELVDGVVTVNGGKATKRLRRRIGYVLQEDCFFSHLTVKQTLQFAGELRLPDGLPRQKKIEKVEQLMVCLGLKKCENTEMGGGIFVKGISGGERKRSSVAVEMITNPSLLLMDEPTSGLDSSTAFNLISTLRNLARSQNRAIVATIHQPSSQLFHMFDKLLLLCNGQVAYFGETLKVVDFFSSINMPCYPNWNPADFLMEKLTSGREIEEKVIQGFKDSWEPAVSRSGTGKAHELNAHPVISEYVTEQILLDTPEIPNGKIGHKDLKNSRSDAREIIQPKKKRGKKPPKWPTSFQTQLRVLSARSFHQTKSDLWDKLGFIQTVSLAIVIGLIWWDTPLKEEAVRDKQGVLFFMIIYLSFNPIFAALFTFPAERNVIAKERAAGMYRLSAYFFAKCVSELPLVLFQPMILHLIAYWCSGMNRSEYYLLSLATVFMTVFFAQSLGLFISAIVKDLKKAMTVAVISTVSSLLLAGFYNKNIPVWLRWVRYVSFISYSYNALLRVDFYYERKAFSCATTDSAFSQCLRSSSSMNGSMAFITGEELYEASKSVSFGVGESLAWLIGGSALLRIGCYLGLKYFDKSR